MSFDICGWVEVNRMSVEDEDDDYVWQGLINLSAFIDVGDVVSERLFGLSKCYVRGDLELNAFAANRGLPLKMSEQLNAEIDRNNELEKKYGKGEIGGYTHAKYDEIKNCMLNEIDLNGSDWNKLFQILDLLCQEERFSEDRLRIVVWFVW